MKTRNKSYSFFAKGAICLALSALAAQEAMAQSEGHGGEIVYVNGRITLRDEVDNTDVFCKPGQDVVKDAALWSPIMEEASKLNWYIRRAYELEVSKMFFCFGNARLVQVWAEDPNASFFPYTRDHATFTAARRKGQIVRVDKELFDKIRDEAPETFAKLIVHEVTHGLIPEYSAYQERNNSVRSFTDILVNLKTQPISAQALADQMKVHQVMISRRFDLFEHYKDDLSTLFDVYAAFSDRVRAAQRVILIQDQLQIEDQRLIDSLLNEMKMIEYKDDLFRYAVWWGDAELVQKSLSLGANPNQIVGGRPAIQFAVYFDLQRTFQAIFENPKTDLAGALDLAYQLRRKAMLLVLAADPRASLTETTLKQMIADDDQSYFDGVQGQKALVNSIGFSSYVDIVLPHLAGSYEKGARESAFLREFVGDHGYATKDLYAYALYRGFEATSHQLLSSHYSELAFIRNAQGENTLDIAIQNGNLDTIDQIMRDSQYNPSELNPTTGNTYLQTAVIYDQVEVVKKLVADSRTNTHQQNVSGKTALDLAHRFKRTTIITILENVK